jgi:hypothetical protein
MQNRYIPRDLGRITISRRRTILRVAATTFFQRNQAALPNRKDVYPLLGMPNMTHSL